MCVNCSLLLVFFNRDYLGEATCSSTRELDLGNCGLGDSGYKTLLSVCRAISSPVSSNEYVLSTGGSRRTFYVVPHPANAHISIIQMEASGTRSFKDT